MKKAVLILSLLFLSIASYSQSNYDQAIGLRLGGGTTFSYKNYLGDNNIELQASIWKHGTRFAGLYEFNYPIQSINGLNFIVGPGIHLGFWDSGYKDQHKDAGGTEFGIDGIIGLDYGFPKIPINISIDWQPSLILAGGSDFTPNLGGIGIRYIF